MYPFRLLRTLTSRLAMSGNVEAGFECRESTKPSAQKSRHDTSSSSTPAASGWQIASASVRGATHERSSAPNQDALCWWSAEGENPMAVLCVADGHGGSEYTHSHIGAFCAVKVARMLLVREVLPRILDGSALKDLVLYKRQLEQQLKRDLVRRWKASVYEHATDHLIREEEKTGQKVVTIERRYGATLVAALLTPALHLYIQLGDGDILTLSTEGEVTRPPFEEDSHLLANHTTSLCSKEAWRFVRVHFQPIVTKPPALVMLATDGYTNSFADDTAFEQVAKDFYAAIQQDGPADVAGLLPGWLKETSGAGSGDDISVVIATN